MDKADVLQDIAKEIENCQECLKSREFGLPVPGEGNSDAEVVFVGEAPGKLEAESGRPFVGRSGKILTKLIEHIGLTREKVFITSIGKFYPGVRAPSDVEIEHSKEHLMKQIEIIKPKLIVLLGAAAHKAFDLNPKIMQVHGTVTEKNGIKFYSTFHPSIVVRGFRKSGILMHDDFDKLKELLRTI